MSTLLVLVSCLCGGLVVTLGLIVSLHRQLRGHESHLRRLPDTVSSAVRRTQGESSFDAAKAASLVAGIREHHDAMAASLRAQLEDAELRARLVERSASDAGIALDTAVQLVREARAMVERLTRDPAQVAAGLGPRPNASTGTNDSATTRPTARPKPHLPPKRSGLHGILPPPPVMPNSDDRSSEEEMTKVVPREAIEAKVTATTLASMPAVVPPGGARGAS